MVQLNIALLRRWYMIEVEFLKRFLTMVTTGAVSAEVLKQMIKQINMKVLMNGAWYELEGSMLRGRDGALYDISIAGIEDFKIEEKDDFDSIL